MSFFSKEIIVLPLIAITVGIVIYLMSDRVLGFLRDKSFGKKDEIVKLLKLMSAEFDEKKLNLIVLLLSFGFGFLAFLIFWPNIVFGLIMGAAVTVGGWSLPLIIVRNLYNSRCNKFVAQMVDGLTIMANGIKSGTNAVQSMQRVIEIMDNPISKEFQIIVDQTQLGSSFEDALLQLGERIPRPDVQMFVTSITILKETGGNLSETFETIVSVIRERQKLEKKIEAMTAQGVMQGMIVTMVPFILAIVFYFMDPKFIEPMFSSTLGLVLLSVMIGLQIIGGVMIRKIVTIKV